MSKNVLLYRRAFLESSLIDNETHSHYRLPCIFWQRLWNCSMHLLIKKQLETPKAVLVRYIWLVCFALALLANIAAIYGIERMLFGLGQEQLQEAHHFRLHFDARASLPMSFQRSASIDLRDPSNLQEKYLLHALARGKKEQYILAAHKILPKAKSAKVRRKQKGRSSPLQNPGLASSARQDPASVIYKARYVRQFPPRYPRRAWELGQQGRVVLRLLIGTEGRASKWKLHRSSGYRLLDKAAIAAVEKWEFEVEKRDSEAKEHWIELPILFHIE